MYQNYTYNVTITYKAGNKGYEYNKKRKLYNIPADSHEHALTLAKEFYRDTFGRDFKIHSLQSELNDIDVYDDYNAPENQR